LHATSGQLGQITGEVAAVGGQGVARQAALDRKVVEVCLNRTSQVAGRRNRASWR
jgi:hypothetical protein